jgi:hypothetical protein
MFLYLVISISLVYVHALARYFYLATILRLDHVRGVGAGFSNILSAGGSMALEHFHLLLYYTNTR